MAISAYLIHKPAYLPRIGTFAPQYLLLAILGFALIAVISFIVHNNPPSGTTEFWMTRPITGGQLFANKFVVVFLVCVLMPVATLQLLSIIGLTGNASSSHSHVIVNIAQADMLVGFLCLMLIASLTKNMKEYAAFIFCIFIIFTISLFPLARPASQAKKQAIQYSNALDWTLAGLAIAGLFFVIYNQYTRRNRKITVLLSALLALVLYGIWRLWPVVS